MVQDSCITLCPILCFLNSVSRTAPSLSGFIANLTGQSQQMSTGYHDIEIKSLHRGILISKVGEALSNTTVQPDPTTLEQAGWTARIARIPPINIIFWHFNLKLSSSRITIELLFGCTHMKMDEKWSLLGGGPGVHISPTGFSSRERKCLLVALLCASTCLFLV